MDTLKELWDAGGGKPMNVVRSDGERFMMLGITPGNFAVGYSLEDEKPQIWDASFYLWSLYEEPRPKKKMYAYLRVDNGKIINPIHCLVFADSEMNFTPASSQDKYKMIRVPQFDCEADDV